MASKLASLLVKIGADSAEFRKEMNKISRQLEKFGREANKQSNRVKYAFNKIRRAAQVVASVFIFTAGIRSLGRLASAVELAEDRVKLMQARFAQFARAPDAFARNYELSKKLGMSLEDTAQSMTRLLIATKNLGTSHSDVEKMVENIVILGRAGGTSAEEMKGAIRQFSQGLSSGVLAGEELRSVMENLPLLAYEIAEQLGVSIGRLRQMGKEGKITGEVGVAASKEIGIALEEIPKTFTQQTENMRTEWDLFLADLGKAVESAELLKDLTEAIKVIRVQWLGGTAGVPTEELNRQYRENTLEIIKLQKEQNAAREQARKELKKNIELVDVPSGATALGALDNIRRLELEIQKLQERNEVLAAAVHAEDLLARHAKKRIEVADAVDSGRTAEELEKLAAKFQKAYATVEQQVARELEDFSLVDHMFKDDDAQRIKSEIQSILTEGIEEINLTALKGRAKRPPELFKEFKKQLTDMEVAADQAARNIQDSFADFLFDPFEDGIKGMLKGFLDAIRRMIAELAAAELFGPKSGFGRFFGSFFGTRAAGGPVAAGMPYLVGERGPELFVPQGVSGTIIPNHKLSAAGGVNMVYHIDARGADEARIMRIMPAMLERAKQESIGEMMRLRDEGRL